MHTANGAQAGPARGITLLKLTDKQYQYLLLFGHRDHQSLPHATGLFDCLRVPLLTVNGTFRAAARFCSARRDRPAA